MAVMRPQSPTRRSSAEHVATRTTSSRQIKSTPRVSKQGIDDAVRGSHLAKRRLAAWQLYKNTFLSDDADVLSDVKARLAKVEPSWAPRPKPRPEPLRPRVNRGAGYQTHDIYMMGDGCNGELGMGIVPAGVEATFPRLNDLLSEPKPGIVQMAVGGRHVLALTQSNKILSWGVNDDFQLGRKTGEMSDNNLAANRNVLETGARAPKSANANEVSIAEKSHLNPAESTPSQIDQGEFPERVIITKIAAADSASFAITLYGDVYGWGSVINDGDDIGFRPYNPTKSDGRQPKPMLIPELKSITNIACGISHFLALDKTGNVYSWGASEHYQLGRRASPRILANGLIPRLIPCLPRKKFKHIACGSHHCFAIEDDGSVWAWGLNCNGQCADPDTTGKDDEEGHITHPKRIPILSSLKLETIVAGDHHSLAIASDGACYAWGRAIEGQLGLDLSKVPDEDKIVENGKVVIVTTPTRIEHAHNIRLIAAASSHSLFIDSEGHAFSFGTNQSYEIGQGRTLEQVDLPTPLLDKHVSDHRVVWAGTGSRFSVLMSEHKGRLATGRIPRQQSAVEGTKQGEARIGAM